MADETGEAVRQWRAKAQGDWTTVEILLGSERCPADTVCFHCQQFVEKLRPGQGLRFELRLRWTTGGRKFLNADSGLECSFAAGSFAQRWLLLSARSEPEKSI